MTSLSENTVVTTSGGLVELGYAERTSAYEHSLASVSTAADVFASDLTFIADGSTVIVEFYSPSIRVLDSAHGAYVHLVNAAGTSLGIMGRFFDQLSPDGESPCYCQYRYTPPAGATTINIRGVSSAAGSRINLAGGGAGAETNTPMYLRVSKVVQASQFIVPLASAPLVTSLPSAPIDGQEIRYLADATNGVIWNLRYRAASASSYKWEFIGGPPLYIAGGGYQTITSTSYVDLTGVALSIPLSGDYDVRLDAQMQQPGGNGWVTYLAVSNNGSTTGDYSFPISYAPATYSVDRGDSRVNRMTLTASTLQGRARVNAGTGYVGYCKLTASPIRVG